jgi:type IV pilus assembly protein PilQ
MTSRPESFAAQGSRAVRRRSLLAQAALYLAAAFATLGLTGPAGVLAEEAPGNYLDDIEVVTLPGQQVQLKLKMRAPAPAPLSFTISNPARIAIDLPDTGLAMSARKRDIGIGGVQTVLAAEASGRTRVVLNLDSLVPYETHVEGNSVVVTLGEGSAAAAAATGFGPAQTEQPPAAAPAPGVKQVNSIDFRRGEDGAGRILIALSDPRTVVDLQQEGDQVIAVVHDTMLPAELVRRLDVLDFATPVQTIDALQSNDNARIVITGSGDFEQLAYQSDNLFTVELKPRTREEIALAEAEAEKQYTGEALTLNFQDIETRAVLQLLAEVSGLNIVVSDTVAGNVTLRLQNVPWDQALDIVLRTKGLDMRQEGNVVIVAPAEEIANRERRELEAHKQIQELAPLRSEFVQVNYAKAVELANLIQSSQGQNSLLSERGSVSIDERTNTLLIQDTSEKLAEIRRLVRTLDIPVRQVLIEARIVVVNDDFSRELGVRMGITGVTDNGDDGLIAVSGSADGNDTIVGSALDNLQHTGNPFPVTVPSLDDRLNVNVPIASPAGRFALAILDSDYLVDLELTAMENEGRGEIKSTPRVITANQKEATIKQGVEIPYQQASSSGATTTQFKEAVLALKVIPQITPDDRIIMDLDVSQDTVGEQVPSATGGFVPSIDTRNVITQVLVNNGETVVLGGIHEVETRETYTKVPFLGDIPGLGKLFSSTQRTNNKAELLIFVTPRILKEGSNVY